MKPFGPFRLVDRVVEYSPGERIEAVCELLERFHSEKEISCSPGPQESNKVAVRHSRMLPAYSLRGQALAGIQPCACSPGDLLEGCAFSSLLVEIAAQTCALMVRLDGEGTRDSFLGKIRSFRFHNAACTPTRLLASARAVSTGRDVVRFQGEVKSGSRELLADFDLLICSTDALGGAADERRRYWRAYLEGVM